MHHAQGASAFSTSSASLSLNLSAHGLGPHFRLLVAVRNDGSSHVRDTPVVRVFLSNMLRCADEVGADLNVRRLGAVSVPLAWVWLCAIPSSSLP